MIQRCPECGSWEAECGASAPVPDCGCARCLRARLRQAEDRANVAGLAGELHRARLSRALFLLKEWYGTGTRLDPWLDERTRDFLKEVQHG